MNNTNNRIINPKVINFCAGNNVALVQVRGNIGRRYYHCFVEVGSGYCKVREILGPRGNYNTIRVEWAAIEFCWKNGIVIP